MFQAPDKTERIIKEVIGLFFVIFMVLFAVSSTAQAKTTRIKDIVDIEGVRENQLVGYGIVVGLNGTGDGLNNSPFTRQSLEAMLERLGVSVRDQNMNTGNVAAVMVTATLPPFTNQGSHIDVVHRSMVRIKKWTLHYNRVAHPANYCAFHSFHR